MTLILRKPVSFAPTLAVLALGVVVVEALIATSVLNVVASGGAIGDWIAFYTAGTLIRTGDGVHLYDVSTQVAAQRVLFGAGNEPFGYTLPAFVAFLFAPLSRLSFAASWWVWFAVNLAMLGGLLRLGWGWLRDVQPALRATFLACAVLSLPALDVLLLGQVDLFVLAGIAGCYALLRADRPFTAGAVLALALFKPHLAIAAVLLLLVKGQWRALAGFAAVGGPLLIVPALLLGPQALADQVALVASYPGTATELRVEAEMMINVRGMVTSFTGTSDVWMWLPAFALIAAVGLYLAVRTWTSRPALHPQSWALAFALPLLYSPHAHAQSMVLLIGAAALYLAASQSSDRPKVSVEWVLVAFIATTVLWLVSLAGAALMVVLVLGAYGLFARRWPETPAAGVAASGSLEAA